MMEPGLERLRIRSVLSAATTGGACSAFELAGEAGAVVPPHRRSCDVVALLVGGEVAVQVGSDRARHSAGRPLWLPRETACRIEFLTAARLVCVAVPSAFDELVERCGDPAIGPDDLAVLLPLAGISLLPPSWGAFTGSAV